MKLKSVVIALYAVADALAKIPASERAMAHEADESPDENELTEIHGSLNDLHARTRVLVDNVAAIFKTGKVRDKRLCTNEDAIGALAQQIGDLRSSLNGYASTIRATCTFVEAQRGLNESTVGSIEELRRKSQALVSTCESQTGINNQLEKLLDLQKEMIDANDIDISKRIGSLEANVSDLSVRTNEHESELLTLTHPDHHNPIVRRIETLLDNHGHMTNRLDIMANTVNAASAFHRALDERVTAVDQVLTTRIDAVARTVSDFEKGAKEWFENVAKSLSGGGT